MRWIGRVELMLCSALAACTKPVPPPGIPGTPDPLVILVQPLGDIPDVQLDSVRVALEQGHMAQVHVAGMRALPVGAFTAVRTPRYRADTLIAWLRKVKPDSVDLIIGITAQDISITKYDASGAIKEPKDRYRDFGIFGLGYIGGPSSVVSTYRLGDGHGPVFFDRLMKVTIHEVGHNRRLPHCSDPRCVMRDAVERMASIDGASRSMCARCSRSLNAQ